MNINTQEDLAKVLASPKLNAGEKSLVKWQYRDHGGFWMTQWDAISKADMRNLFLLKAAFPEHVEAYCDFSQTGKLSEKVDQILKGESDE